MIYDVAGFIICSAFIFYSGSKLSIYGDIIAEQTGWGRAWVGLILLATVTSLPEMATGISSVRIVNSADLAVGNALGSCVFNLAILSLLDALTPKEPLLTKVRQSHLLAASLSILLLAFVGIGLQLTDTIGSVGWIGGMTFVFIIGYLLSVKLLHVFSQRENKEVDIHPQKRKITLRKAVLWYAFHGMVVVVAAMALPFFAEHIAEKSGLGESFVGTLLMAASTSFPEIAVSVAAARIGSVDMAVGNLFGSNIFNVATLALDDIFFTEGNLLSFASASHNISVFSVIIMSSIAVMGLTFRSKRKRFMMALDTFLILLIYIGNMVVLYFYE